MQALLSGDFLTSCWPKHICTLGLERKNHKASDTARETKSLTVFISLRRCLRDNAGDVAFTRGSTVLGKGKEEAVGAAPTIMSVHRHSDVQVTGVSSFQPHCH